MDRPDPRSVESRSSSVPRRTFLSLLGVGGAATLAGCSSSSSGDSGDGGSETTESTTTEQGGGEIALASTLEPNEINPITHNTAPEYQVTTWTYSSLTRYDNNLNVHPDLATDWESNDDQTVWTFEMRDDAEFSYDGGTEVTASDVKATLDAVESEEYGSPGRGNIGPIDEVTAVDPTTVEIQLTQAYKDMPVKMGKPFARVLPEEVVEDGPDGDLYAEASSSDFGSGPFNLEKFTSGNEVIVTADDDYYLTDESGNTLPHLDRITQSVYPEATGELTALQNGDVDIDWKVPSGQWSRAQGMSGVTSNRVVSGTYPLVAMNLDKEPFTDYKVTKAVRLALDREAILEGAINGLGSVARDTPVSPDYASHIDLPSRSPDRERAQELLDEAGYPDGFEVDYYVLQSPAYSRKTAVQVSSQLEEVGIQANVQQVTSDRFFSSVWLSETMYNSHFYPRPVEDDLLFKTCHSEGPWNMANWSDEEFDTTLMDAMSASDEERQNELYGRCQEILYERGPYAIPIFVDQRTAWRNSVEGYNISATDTFLNMMDVTNG